MAKITASIVNTKRLIFLIVLFLTAGISAKAETSQNKDSAEVYTKVSEFFTWYLNVIEEEHYKEFQPLFAEGKNGMTTLDYSIYMDNLKRYHFSDSLIQKEKLSYQKCIGNLEKIKYADFKTKYTDLGQFEDIDCDFSNSYRWTGGQEAPDKFKITNIEFKDTATALVTISYGSSSAGENENSYWGNLIISMKNISGIWKIIKIIQ